ncbi:MAG TPA: hypothetical protein VFR41_14300 [Acidimicrobiia bacterium]|nr:hypothetical protein [Acidimicrobiia bacterium]
MSDPKQEDAAERPDDANHDDATAAARERARARAGDDGLPRKSGPPRSGSSA